MIRKLLIIIRSVLFCMKTKTKLKNMPKVLGKVYFRSKKHDIKIGKNITIFPGVVFWGTGKLIIGDNVTLGDRVIILASKNGGIKIGDNTMIAANCYIIDCNHGTKLNGVPMLNQDLNAEQITIGSDCWICSNCVVGKGAYLPNGSVLGACSFANKKYSDYENYIIGGVPAKPISKRK